MDKPILYSCPLGHSCQTETETEIRRCMWYIHLRGKDPQSEKEIDEWSCAMSFMPLLQIESSQQMRQAGAAIESFRNETVKGNEKFLGLVQGARKLANNTDR